MWLESRNLPAGQLQPALWNGQRQPETGSLKPVWGAAQQLLETVQHAGARTAAEALLGWAAAHCLSSEKTG